MKACFGLFLGKIINIFFQLPVVPERIYAGDDVFIDRELHAARGAAPHYAGGENFKRPRQNVRGAFNRHRAGAHRICLRAGSAHQGHHGGRHQGMIFAENFL